MTTEVQSTASLLRHAILLDPADDAVRLVYADEIEESEPELAEFVRVQIELAAMGPPSIPVDDPYGKMIARYDALRHRERQLLLETAGAYRLCPAPEGFGPCIGYSEVKEGYEFAWLALQSGNDFVHYVPTRGFPSHLRLTLADFLKHAGELFKAHPITSVRLTDAEPHETRSPDPAYSGFMFCRNECESRDPWGIPSAIYDWMGNYIVIHPKRGELRASKFYSNRDATHAALSTACVRYGRSLAGLP